MTMVTVRYNTIGGEQTYPKGLPKRLFLTKGGKIAYPLDDTSLFPNKETRLSKDMYSSYLKQVEELFFTSDDEVNFKKLLPLLIISESVEKGLAPITIQVNLQEKKKRIVTQVLEDFYKENKDHIKYLYKAYVEQLGKK